VGRLSVCTIGRGDQIGEALHSAGTWLGWCEQGADAIPSGAYLITERDFG